VQLHNLPKVKMGPGAAGLALLVAEAGDLDLLERLEDRPLSVLSQLLRSVVAAPPGRRLLGADFSAIEARVVAWLAGQEDVLALLREYDAARLRGERRQDLYEYAAEGIGSTRRDLGKVCTLALGFGMGVLKLAAKGEEYGIFMTLKEWYRAHSKWRAANGSIVQYWRDLQDAAYEVVRAGPGARVRVGRVALAMQAGCLSLVLPSGRPIRYWRPEVVTATKKLKVVDEEGVVSEFEVTGDELRYYAPGPDGASMVLESTYGGKLAENATQGTARELLAEALLRLDAAGHEVVLHVHDSVASEVDDGAGDAAAYGAEVARVPHWAAGLPVAADAYLARRFRG
jgi:DNA polymerase